MDFREYSELYHHGIKGMHWGVRRYQNPDGTLTEAGLRRYAGSTRRKLVDDSILLAEQRHNDRKDKVKSDYDNNKIDKITYKNKRKELRKQFREERKSIKIESKKLNEKELNERFKSVRNKAIKEIPNYKIKRGAQVANKILTGINIGRGALSMAALYIASGGLGIGPLVGGALGTAAKGYAGYKVRNKIRRQFT